MIKKIHIQNYRIFKNLVIEVKDGLNIIVGDNEAGKSTLLEAISLALNGKINGRWASDELNPYWFNTDAVREFYESFSNGKSESPPTILIELYFGKNDQPQKLRGKNNYFRQDCPGISLCIEPDPEYIERFKKYLKSDTSLMLPTEYYQITWKGFNGPELKRRPQELRTSIIDGSTIKFSRSIDYQARQILFNYIDDQENVDISVDYRRARYDLTESMLGKVNKRIKEETKEINNHDISLQMDQSSMANWENSVVPHVDDVPFSMAGQGQQVLMKVILALKSSTDKSNFIFIEEPENHLSYTSLTSFVKIIEGFSSGRQTFIATHSSYVLNRLGLDRLILLHKGNKAKFDELSEDTIRYFQKQSGYDTLRLVLARKLVVVEGPSDEMLFNRAYFDVVGKYPQDNGIDVITQGTRNRRALELCNALDRSVAILRDVDYQTPEYWKEKAINYLEEGKREMFIGCSESGTTLEPQIIYANQHNLCNLSSIIGCPEDENLCEFMTSNKTEVAWQIATNEKSINYPQYFLDAIDFINKL